MVHAEVIRKRLNKLDEYVRILKRLQSYKKDDFLSNPEHYGSAERFLHLAIEATLDMGNHIIAELNLGTVNWYSDIPALLFKYSYIDSAFEKTWTRMIGFRNALVHDYMDIDRLEVYNVLQNHLIDFDNFKKLFAEFL